MEPDPVSRDVQKLSHKSVILLQRYFYNLGVNIGQKENHLACDIAIDDDSVDLILAEIVPSLHISYAIKMDLSHNTDIQHIVYDTIKWIMCINAPLKVFSGSLEDLFDIQFEEYSKQMSEKRASQNSEPLNHNVVDTSSTTAERRNESDTDEVVHIVSSQERKENIDTPSISSAAPSPSLAPLRLKKTDLPVRMRDVHPGCIIANENFGAQFIIKIDIFLAGPVLAEPSLWELFCDMIDAIWCYDKREADDNDVDTKASVACVYGALTDGQRWYFCKLYRLHKDAFSKYQIDISSCMTLFNIDVAGSIKGTTDSRDVVKYLLMCLDSEKSGNLDKISALVSRKKRESHLCFSEFEKTMNHGAKLEELQNTLDKVKLENNRALESIAEQVAKLTAEKDAEIARLLAQLRE